MSLTRLIRRAGLIGLLLLAPLACAQYIPPAAAAYINPSGTGWDAWTSAAGFGSLSYSPPAVGLYCQASAGAAWQPCAPGGGGGGGTVTSVGDLSPIFTVTSRTTTPTFNLTTAAQNAVFAGPSSGGTGAPSYRALTSADIPALAYLTAATLTANRIPKATAAAALANSSISDDGTTISSAEVFSSSVSNSAGVPAFLWSGAVLAATNATPFLYYNYVSNTTQPTNFSATGTLFGGNLPAVAIGSIFDFKTNGGTNSVFRVSGSGGVTTSSVANVSNNSTLNLTNGGINFTQTTAADVGLLVNNTGTPTADLLNLDANTVIVYGVNAKGTPATKVSTNVDAAGILALAAATTASYTFLTTGYATHPVCVGAPDADPGSGVRWWITYTAATSFTVNFSSAFTGNFDYHCIART